MTLCKIIMRLPAIDSIRWIDKNKIFWFEYATLSNILILIDAPCKISTCKSSALYRHHHVTQILDMPFNLLHWCIYNAHIWFQHFFDIQNVKYLLYFHIMMVLKHFRNNQPSLQFAPNILTADCSVLSYSKMGGSRTRMVFWNAKFKSLLWHD